MYSCKFEWPNGANIAVVFNISWETWPKILGTSKNNQRAGEAVPANAKYDRSMMRIYEHAYAETAGMQRLLDVFQRHEVETSIYCDGWTVKLYPELAKKAFREGHEFLAQGWDHSFCWELSVAELEDSINKTVDVFESVLGKRPIGFSSSGGSMTPESFPIVADLGFKYCCGFRNTDVPFVFNVGEKKLVGMNSYALTDYNSYGSTELSPRELNQMWRDFFDTLYAEGERGFPKMLAFGTHPFLGHGHRTLPMEETIEYVKSRPNVWVTTREKIAEYVLANYPNQYLSDFYPEAIASDKHYGLSLGLGGEEAVREALSYRRV